ncbi:hypothetical protein [Alteromonas lipotrueae]|uniref:hypothetical protein n=1 Tax=Alteromonas lipotrueae TaxID=2803814 RepID=UPI001C43DA51|nr:hypothetical protein [Alteromonas lipotrueae]
MSRANTALKAEHEYICGNSGTGKSSHVKKVIEKAKRVVVYDPDDEYGDQRGFVRVTSANDLAKMLQSHAKKPLKITYAPMRSTVKTFEFWARCAFLWGECVAVAEEIADVTSAGKAPPNWGTLIRRGRKYGVKILAVTQRPAEADKTILSNAAIIHCCALGRMADRKAIASEMDCDVSLIAKMIPLDFIVYKRADLSLRAGNLKTQRTKLIR